MKTQFKNFNFYLLCTKLTTPGGQHTEFGGKNSGVAQIHYLLMIDDFKLSMLLLSFNVITVSGSSAFEFNNGKEPKNQNL